MHIVRDNRSEELKKVDNDINDNDKIEVNLETGVDSALVDMIEQNKPIIKDMLMLVKNTDGKARQILLTEEQMLIVLRVLVETSKDKCVMIRQEPLEGVDWTSDFDLTKVK